MFILLWWASPSTSAEKRIVYFPKPQFSKMRDYWFITQILYDTFIPVNSVLQNQQLSLHFKDKAAMALRHGKEMSGHTHGYTECYRLKHTPGELWLLLTFQQWTYDQAHWLDKKQSCWSTANYLTQWNSTTAFLWAAEELVQKWCYCETLLANNQEVANLGKEDRKVAFLSFSNFNLICNTLKSVPKYRKLSWFAYICSNLKENHISILAKISCNF